MRGERVSHRERHRAHVPRRVWTLRDHPPLGVEHRDREVLPLARLFGVGRLVHRGADLDGDRLQRAPDHAERNGIYCSECRVLGLRRGWPVRDAAWLRHRAISTMRLAYSSTVAEVPGGSTDVDSRSSTIAGPSTREPGVSV